MDEFYLPIIKMSDEKIYCGNGKKIPTQYGDLMKISFTAEDLQKMQDNLENGWINLNLKERREPSERGTTHYLEVDTWKPTGGASNSKSAPKKSDEAELTAEDLPF